MPLAVVCKEYGPPENCVLEEFDPGPPGAGEVRMAIRAAGISFVDVLQVTGNYQWKKPLPYIPGTEASGVIEAVGEGVDHLRVGDNAFFTFGQGVFCEVNNFPANRVSRLGPGASLESAAVMIANYQTALYALEERGRARAGETLLVLGAAGGTGYAAVQVGKLLGLRVIASASTDAKRQAALDGGADAVVETGAADWRDQVKAANGGRPVDLVFDPVGGDLTELALRNLDYDGRLLVIGFPAGIASVPTNLPLLKSASVVGVHLGDAMNRRPDVAARIRARIVDLAGQGAFTPAIAARYPLRDYAAAMKAAFSGKAAGRILLTMG